MREIKFRGKRLDNGEWIYGSLLVSLFKDDKKERYFITQFSGNYTFEHEVDPATVGQYTGLKDVSGTDIWEDDIMRIPETCFNAEINGRVLFEEDAYYIIPLQDGHLWGLHWSLRKHNAKIIGNIYDSPELLKTE